MCSKAGNHASTPTVFTGRMPFLPPNQQCQSTEGNWKKPKSKKTDKLRSIGKQSGVICGVSLEEEKEGYGGKDLQRWKVLRLEWKSEGVIEY